MGQACSKSYFDRHRYRDEPKIGETDRLGTVAYLSAKQRGVEVKYVEGIPSTMVVDAPNKLRRVSKMRVICRNATFDDNLRLAVYDFVETVGGQVTADKDVAADSVVTLLYADLHDMLKTAFLTQQRLEPLENEEDDDHDESDDDDETDIYNEQSLEDDGGDFATSDDVEQGEGKNGKENRKKKEEYYVEEAFSIPMFTQSTLVKVDVIIGVLSPAPSYSSFHISSHSSSSYFPASSASNLNSSHNSPYPNSHARNHRRKLFQYSRAQNPQHDKKKEGPHQNERCRTIQTGAFYVADVSFINLTSLSFTEICFLTDIALCTRLYARSHVVIAQLLYRTALMDSNRRDRHSITANVGMNTLCVNCNKEGTPQMTCIVCQFSDLQNLIAREYEHLNNSVESPNSHGEGTNL